MQRPRRFSWALLLVLPLTGCVIKTRPASDTPPGTSDPTAPTATGAPAATDAPAAATPASPSPTAAPPSAGPTTTPSRNAPPVLSAAPQAPKTPPALSAAPPASAAPAPTASAPPAPPPAPPESEKPAEHKLIEAAGQPKGMQAGAPISFWVWHDDDGKRWHLRTTTAKKEDHRFSGRVWVTQGSLKDVQPSRIELMDRLKSDDRTATFDFTTGGHIDGFDFSLRDANCVRFLLLVDEKREPGYVRIGERATKPKAASFRLCR